MCLFALIIFTARIPPKGFIFLKLLTGKGDSKSLGVLQGHP